jgi:hypothetical protein
MEYFFSDVEFVAAGGFHREVTRDDILMLKKGSDFTNQHLRVLDEKVHGPVYKRAPSLHSSTPLSSLPASCARVRN